MALWWIAVTTYTSIHSEIAATKVSWTSLILVVVVTFEVISEISFGELVRSIIHWIVISWLSPLSIPIFVLNLVGDSLELIELG